MLRIEHLVKRYGAHKALAGASLDVRPGEIHGLAGLNGSGKTTLLNILFGAAAGTFEGGVTLDGRPFAPRTPREAMASGVGMIHQELSLFDGLTVAENVTLTRESASPLARRLLGADFCLERPGEDRKRTIRALSRLGLSPTFGRAGCRSALAISWRSPGRSTGRTCACCFWTNPRPLWPRRTRPGFFAFCANSPGTGSWCSTSPTGWTSWPVFATP